MNIKEISKQPHAKKMLRNRWGTNFETAFICTYAGIPYLPECKTIL